HVSAEVGVAPSAVACGLASDRDEVRDGAAIRAIAEAARGVVTEARVRACDGDRRSWARPWIRALLAAADGGVVPLPLRRPKSTVQYAERERLVPRDAVHRSVLIASRRVRPRREGVAMHANEEPSRIAGKGRVPCGVPSTLADHAVQRSRTCT